MRGLAAPLSLVGARARRRPGRWLPMALGIALAAAFLAGVAAEGTVAADQGARAVLAGLSPLQRTVRVTWQGPVTPAVAPAARRLLSGLGLGAQTQVVLLGPVRLGGVIVRPAAIDPLTRWLPGAATLRLGRCAAASCPMLEAGGGAVSPTLVTAGARITVSRASPLASAVPLAFSPLASGVQPVLVTGDVGGLERLPGLSGVYRTYSRLAPLVVAGLRSWQLPTVEERLARSAAALQVSGSRFSLSAPFDGLDAARAQASAAPRRLLLVAGGAAAILVLFVLLAAAGLRRDQLAELDRLRRAGARSGQCLLFVAADSGWVCAAALIAGSAIGVLGAVVLSSASGEPVAGVLAHSLLTPAAVLGLAGAWIVTTLLMVVSTLARDQRVLDVLAIVAVAVLVVGLTSNPGGDTLPALLAPLSCLAAGVITFRLAAAVLRLGERVSRDGAVRTRLAFVGLARAPSLPSAAIAFVAVSVGLGGFALAYRATLVRGAADQASDRVPLDALVSAGPNFDPPLTLAPLTRWRALAGGPVLPVRRTDAAYINGDTTVTVPALGVPADGLRLIHGWRGSDGSAPLAVLARRLRPPGPVSVPGPSLPAGAASLAIRASAPATAVVLTAALRGPGGAVTPVTLGTAGPAGRELRARIPPGQWELEALELGEPTGLEITNAHQNAENPGASTQQQSLVRLGSVRALSQTGHVLLAASLGTWRAVGAAAPAGPGSSTAGAAVTFDTTGQPGVVRPQQPSDTRPVPVLADPQTAASAGPAGRLSLTVDGLPVLARVVGELRRFPTLAPDAAGFVVADGATLSAALDAQLPGQGRSDELWLSSADPGRLRAALERPPLSALSSSFRADIEQQLRTTPLARGVLGTLIAASAVAAALAMVGLLLALLGPGRDQAVERDLREQGIGPG
ncbi:MAG TPA: hypothetical protein VMP89_06915, partial [Solirubrobacteraceae bacterium]|nr:hypothetical protein [Solirubrobacteraceae bacterium]